MPPMLWGFHKVEWLLNGCLLYTSSELKGTKAGRVPSDTYLVLNDNRGDTEDSREFGYIHKNQIEGVVNLRLYPLNKFGFIKVKE